MATTDEEKKLTATGTTGTETPVYAGTTAQNTSSGTAAPTFADTYGSQVNDLYKQITGRDAFSYDVNSDALYQQYKDKYTQQGKQAMKDTMGQAASLTGGYGSSYGQAVGQQQYDSYLQNLNDVIPDLYSNALSAYNSEGDRLNQNLSNAQTMRNTEYSQYQNALDQYNTEQQLAYNKQQDSYSTLASLISSSGYKATDDDLAASGMTADQANALRQSWIVANPVQAYMQGDLDAAGYYTLTGAWPNGYDAGGGDYGYGSGGGDGVNFLDEARQAAQQSGTTAALDYVNSQLAAGNVSQAEAAAATATVRGVAQTHYDSSSNQSKIEALRKQFGYS